MKQDPQEEAQVSYEEYKKALEKADEICRKLDQISARQRGKSTDPSLTKDLDKSKGVFDKLVNKLKGWSE